MDSVMTDILYCYVHGKFLWNVPNKYMDGQKVRSTVICMEK